MKSVLIIGATSVLGRTLGKLLSETYTVSFAGRRSSEIHFDLLSDSALPKHHFDTVVVVAADFGGADVDSMKRAEEANAIGMLRACEVTKSVGAQHLVVISTIFVCQQPDDPLYGIYGLSKRHGEELAQLFCSANKIPLTILRPSQIYDTESACFNHQPLFYKIIDKAEAGENVRIFGTNDAIRNYIHIDDVCNIIVRVINFSILGVFFVTQPRSHTLTEIANMAFGIFNRGGEARFDRDMPDVPDIKNHCGMALYHLAEYAPKIDLFRGITLIKQERDEQCAQ